MTYHDIHALERSTDGDVEAILNVWVEYGDEVLADEKPCSVGVHPDSIDDNIDDVLLAARDLAHGESVIAIGECGLDRSIMVAWDDQLRVFEDLISLSELLCKPIIVHCVRGHAEVLMLHRELNPVQPWVVHAYNKGGDMLDRMIEVGMYVSFDAAIMDDGSPAADALKEAPSGRFFLETGDQTDHDIKTLYARAAELRGQSIPDLCDEIAKTYASVFGQ
jgi:TatD DNase family protein